MLNLGIINSGGSYQDVSLEEVQASQLAYMEAEQRLTDYMNYMEVLEGLQRHSSTECLAFASELLGVPTNSVGRFSQEEYESRVSQESLGVWKTFRKLWDDFVRWIRDLWRRMVKFFSSKKEEESKGASNTAPTAKSEKKSEDKSKYEFKEPKNPHVVINGNAKKQPASKFSSTPKTDFVVGKPTQYDIVATHTSESMKSVRDSASKVEDMFSNYNTKRVNDGVFNSGVKSLMQELQRFNREGKSRSYGLSGYNARTYVSQLDATLSALDRLVKTADRHVDAQYNASYIKSIQMIRNACSKFVRTLTDEFKYWKKKESDSINRATFTHQVRS